MIRVKFWQILQNALRLLVTVGVPIFIVREGGFLDGGAERLSWWALMLIGAFIGGLVSTPASNIGNLIWEILAIHLRRGIEDQASKGYTEEESIVLKNLEYRKWVRLQRKATVFMIAGRVIRRTIILVLLGVALLFTPVVVAAFLINPRGEIILSLLLGIAISGILLAVGFGIATGLGVKSFHHQE